MAYIEPTTRTLAEEITPAIWNTDLVDNIKYLKGKVAGFLAAYNGRTPAGPGSDIGIAFSPDGIHFEKHANNPVIARGASGTWDDDAIGQPSLVYAYGRLYCYYMGQSPVQQIGLATSDDGGLTWQKYSGNPLLTIGGAGTWDDTGLSCPTVLYDPDEADATKRFKMWYSGSPDGTAWDIGYAYSPDGLTWTKYASNPVLARGSAGAFDDVGAMANATPVKVDGTYYMFYDGRPSAGFPHLDAIGLATFTNPESSYTKSASNPLLSPRTSASQALTANASIGDRTLTVTDSSVFEIGEPVLVATGTGSTFEYNRIIRKNSATVVTLLWPLVSAYTTAASSFVRSVFWGGIYGRSLHQTEDGWVLYGTAYQLISGGVFETSAAFKASSLTGPWSFDYDRGLVINPGFTGEWDTASCENPSCVEYDGNHVGANKIAYASVATQENTTSTAYTDLTTPGPAVTVRTGTKARVTLTSYLTNNTAGQVALMSFAVSGATTRAAADAEALVVTPRGVNDAFQMSAVFVISDLTPGLNTFTAKYRTSANTSDFQRRYITVEPL